ncbi:hypothetical protein KTC96_07060 [Clostridium estertheticum]|uniref:hypothetical protein n=1 Tax=Clostridium estertheticum TaxID=238834 RepID=UPI001C7DF519|nr:hypothetical protein [Clostridium estertheticum]MBX4261203.1 hypothetical protein [Clostridium estertheticum]WLC71756.1 hypothetical protein KTC96_07060 [Clostridium estertheticum]
MVKLNMNHMELKKSSIKFLRYIPIAKIIYINGDIDYLRSIKNEIKLITKDSISVSYSANCCWR